jgi:hypothetical protein
MRKRLQSPNKFNAIFKAKLIRKDNIFNLQLEDGTVVYTYLEDKLFKYINRIDLDLDQWYTWRGQYTTSQHPDDENIDVLKVIKLVALENNKKPYKYFDIFGHCFQIQDTQIQKYNKRYNFLLVNLFKDGDKESIKLCYKKLDNPNLEYTEQGHPYLISTKNDRKPVRFTCYQSGNNIVIKEIELLY